MEDGLSGSASQRVNWENGEKTAGSLAFGRKEMMVGRWGLG